MASRRRVQLLVAAILLALLTTSWLSWLLWVYVPFHANVFEAFGVPLPRPAIIAVQLSYNFVRYLPYLTILVSLAALLGVVRFLRRAVFHGDPPIARRVLAGAIGVALLSAATSVFVVWGIHTAYAEAQARGLWKEVARRLQVYRAEHPSTP